MVKTKGIERTVANWKGSAAVIPARYRDGVSAVTGWKEAAIAGDDLYKQRIQEAIAKDLRKKGLEKSSDAEYKKGAIDKGAARIGPGIAAAEGEFRRGMGAVLSTIEGVSLPPKTSDPAQNVLNRVTPIAVALRKLKEGS